MPGDGFLACLILSREEIRSQYPVFKVPQVRSTFFFPVCRSLSRRQASNIRSPSTPVKHCFQLFRNFRSLLRYCLFIGRKQFMALACSRYGISQHLLHNPRSDGFVLVRAYFTLDRGRITLQPRRVTFPFLPGKEKAGSRRCRLVGPGAGDRNRTCNLLFTRQLRYRCATPARRLAYYATSPPSVRAFLITVYLLFGRGITPGGR